MKRVSVFCILLAVLLLGYSCIEDQNFNAFDDLNVVPQFESSIVYVEATEEIINLSGNTTFFSQDFNFNAFSENVFANRVLDGVLTYEVENTTSKPLEIRLEFLDENDTVLDTETFVVLGEPSAVLFRDVMYGNTGKSLDILVNTSKLRVSAINNGDTISTSSQADPLIVLKSSGKFSIRIK